jgi:hypothetical protein
MASNAHGDSVAEHEKMRLDDTFADEETMRLDDRSADPKTTRPPHRVFPSLEAHPQSRGVRVCRCEVVVNQLQLKVGAFEKVTLSPSPKHSS